MFDCTTFNTCTMDNLILKKYTDVVARYASGYVKNHVQVKMNKARLDGMKIKLRGKD